MGAEGKVYDGVGGHLLAIAAEESMKLGYNGFIHSKAANRKLLEYYIEEYGATPTKNGYGFYIDESAASTILEKYTWENK